jgi:arylsulfatase A-like enzyme
MRPNAIGSLLLAAAALGLGLRIAPPALAADAPARPNLVILLADDMGFSDVGCYGGEIATPHIDRLAAKGLRFTQFYNAGRCCPTRASLLTGLYPHQAGVGHMTQDRGAPGYRGFLNDRCVTLAEVLRGAGYVTAMTGKWHVGDRDRSLWPLQRGFDRFYGVPEGGGFYFKVKKGRTVVSGNDALYSAEKQTPDGWYSTDAWTDQGIRFIDEALAAKKPFFLYLAHNAPHFPLQAPPADIARWRGKFREGWDVLRERRYRRQIEMGLIDKAWPLSPRPVPVRAWDVLSDPEKDRFDLIMAIYAAVMERMDRSVGRLVEALDRRGALDNTLLVFLSDNGGNAESGPNGKTAGPSEPGSADSDVFCGQSWATLMNTPFRRYKHYNHEGGIATPLVVHWPARIRTPGEFRRQPGHIVDLMATCVDVAGAAYPAEFNGKPILPMEGRSLVPAFDDKPIARDALFWEHEGNAAVRAGDWKLVRLGRGGAWELYDLKTDRTELTDLAAKEPARARDLAAAWDAWAARAHVTPAPGEGAGGKRAERGANEALEKK